MAVSISRVSKLKRYKGAVSRTEPPRAFIKHQVGKCLTHEYRQEFMKDAPLIVPPQLPGCFFEHAITRDLPVPRLIDEIVVKLEHRKMHLCHQGVRIVARVANHCNAFGVSLHVCAVSAE